MESPNGSLGESSKSQYNAAATTIQKNWRGYQARADAGTRAKERRQMSTDARWHDVKKYADDKTYSTEQLENKNDVKSRWRRAFKAASRLAKGDGLEPMPDRPVDEVHLDKATLKARKATFWGNLSMGVGDVKDDEEDGELPYQSKELEQQHWLEMIDQKHRYGSNMKYYFRAWKEADTQDNFFRWLDRGEGKDLDLEVLPRERFERERITYLSAEKRLNYLVNVDEDGLLRWDHNNELVDTARGKWKDAGDGNGIIPNDESEDEANGDDEEDTDDSASVTSVGSGSWSAASDDLHDNEATHYVGLNDKDNDDDNWFKKKKKEIGPQGVRKTLLRKTVRRNTWIYVSDMKLNLFVGIKKSGTFQHSSFIGGGKVTSAGIIIVKRGLIKSLNPLSGHYRSTIGHFRAFIAQLEAKGADLSHVKIAKSVLSLWGLSKYSKVTKREKDLVSMVKSGLGLSHEPTEMEKSQALQEHAEQEEKEHQERLKAVTRAEEEVDGQDPEKKEKVRKEVLFGKEQVKQEREEDTKKELDQNMNDNDPA